MTQSSGTAQLPAYQERIWAGCDSVRHWCATGRDETKAWAFWLGQKGDSIGALAAELVGGAAGAAQWNQMKGKLSAWPKSFAPAPGGRLATVWGWSCAVTKMAAHAWSMTSNEKEAADQRDARNRLNAIISSSKILEAGLRSAAKKDDDAHIDGASEEVAENPDPIANLQKIQELTKSVQAHYLKNQPVLGGWETEDWRRCAKRAAMLCVTFFIATKVI